MLTPQRQCWSLASWPIGSLWARSPPGRGKRSTIVNDNGTDIGRLRGELLNETLFRALRVPLSERGAPMTTPRGSIRGSAG